MNSIKVILAAVIVLIISNLLVACSSQGVSQVGVQRIKEASELKKTVELKLEEQVGTDVHLKLILENPEQMPISSAETWLAYNPELLTGLEVDTTNSVFELTAPYSNEFDNAAGLVMLGRSTATPITDAEILVAELRFKKLTDGVAMIESYDYKHDLGGHTSVNMMVDLDPVNILLRPDSPLLILEN